MKPSLTDTLTSGRFYFLLQFGFACSKLVMRAKCSNHSQQRCCPVCQSWETKPHRDLAYGATFPALTPNCDWFIAPFVGVASDWSIEHIINNHFSATYNKILFTKYLVFTFAKKLLLAEIIDS